MLLRSKAFRACAEGSAGICRALRWQLHTEGVLCSPKHTPAKPMTETERDCKGVFVGGGSGGSGSAGSGSSSGGSGSGMGVVERRQCKCAPR